MMLIIGGVHLLTRWKTKKECSSRCRLLSGAVSNFPRVLEYGLMPDMMREAVDQEGNDGQANTRENNENNDDAKRI